MKADTAPHLKLYLNLILVKIVENCSSCPSRVEQVFSIDSHRMENDNLKTNLGAKVSFLSGDSLKPGSGQLMTESL